MKRKSIDIKGLLLVALKVIVSFIILIVIIFVIVWLFYFIAQPKEATISADSANSSYMISWHNQEKFSKVSFYCEKLDLSFHLAPDGGYSMPDFLKNPDLMSKEDNIKTKIELKNTGGYYYDDTYYDNSYKLIAESFVSVEILSNYYQISIIGKLNNCVDNTFYFIMESSDSESILISGDMKSELSFVEGGNYYLCNDNNTVPIDSKKSIFLDKTGIEVKSNIETYHLRTFFYNNDGYFGLHKATLDRLDRIFLKDFQGEVSFSFSNKTHKIESDGKDLDVQFDTVTANDEISYQHGYNSKANTSLVKLEFAGDAIRSSLNHHSLFPSFSEWFFNTVLEDPLNLIVLAITMLGIGLPFVIRKKEKTLDEGRGQDYSGLQLDANKNQDDSEILLDEDESHDDSEMPLGEGNNEKITKDKRKKNYKKELKRLIDSLIPQMCSLEDLISSLEDNGYEVELSEEYLLCRLPGQVRFTNTKVLGEEYKNINIIQRIKNNQESV